MEKIDVYLEQRRDALKPIQRKIERLLSLRKEAGTGGLRVLAGLFYELYAATLEVDRIEVFRRVYVKGPRGGEKEGGSDDGVMRPPPAPPPLDAIGVGVRAACKWEVRGHVGSPNSRDWWLAARCDTREEAEAVRASFESQYSDHSYEVVPQTDSLFVAGVRAALEWASRERTDNVSPERDVESVINSVFARLQ